ncbi:MAG TPA: CRISPR system precrRNA processing endoribonuclease RAMP protein Cas6 [Gammaproteobacteria bacterium]|nr:CRISPR system precrRNA processing endoribonuclease RAMP protein Cas6 [Gammaproteobacteria bacterium]
MSDTTRKPGIFGNGRESQLQRLSSSRTTPVDVVDDLPELPLGLIQFRFLAEKSLVFPAYSGSLWHAVFGLALHRQSCIMRGQDCVTCPLRARCDYPTLFKPHAAPDSAMMRGKSVPPPHVFHSIPEARRVVSGEVSISLALLGDAGKRVGAIVNAMRHAGLAGLGKQRVVLYLKDFHQVGWDGEPIAMINTRGDIIEPLFASPPVPVMPSCFALIFTTPCRLSGSSHGCSLDVFKMLMAIIRRISLLQYFYTGKRLNADFKELKSLTKMISVQDISLVWRSAQRYSARRDVRVDTSGWTGVIRLDLRGIEPLWPYLWIGQWLGVGKNASMGFGHYQISFDET